jgi:hypothetical protein
MSAILSGAPVSRRLRAVTTLIHGSADFIADQVRRGAHGVRSKVS